MTRVKSTRSSPVFKYSCANLRIDVGHVAVYLHTNCYNFAVRECDVIKPLLVAGVPVMVIGTAAQVMAHMAV